MIGTTISHYKILEKLGEGGMGVVYKAHDTKLNREVALKFLPPHLAASEQDKARFIQEAQSASSINQPNICTIHDIQEHDGSLFIVMEYVNGHTLRDRLTSHITNPKSAIETGIQIADGLAAAHEKGIVHRDIKPENIMVRKDGIVQIMDFGLAKLRGISRLTKEGSTVGTAGYMSPEQIQGLDPDHRSDIFSLGVLLYEMLTGQLPFRGVHETALAYEIVNVDPSPMTAVKPEIDPAIDAIVLECLAKEPSERFQSAAEVAKELRRQKRESGRSRITGVRQVGAVSKVQMGSVSSQQPVKSIRRERLFWLAIVMIAATGWLVMFLSPGEKPAELLPVRFAVFPPENTIINETVISPDGKTIAFTALGEGKTLLWVRPLTALTPQPLRGTENAEFPFWSPDSRMIGFFMDGKLMKAEVNGGSPIAVCDAPGGIGGTWSSAGQILFSSEPGGLFLVSSGGGERKQITRIDSTTNEYSHWWPWFLPDGKRFLYLSLAVADEAAKVYLGSLDDPTRKMVLRSDAHVVFAPPSHLLFLRNRTLMSQRFDIDTGDLVGDLRPIASDVGHIPRYARGDFSYSPAGVLTTGGGRAVNREYRWFDRNGRELNSASAPGNYFDINLSASGKQAAVQKVDVQTGNSDIWILDIDREVMSRFTFDPAVDDYPVWDADGKYVYFATSGGGTYNIHRKLASGVGSPEAVLPGGIPTIPADVSRDGKYLLFIHGTNLASSDIWVLETANPEKRYALMETPFNEDYPSFSTDGRWLAYVSNESGKEEVYVRAFSSTGGRWQISANGGSQPRWRPDGRELFFVAPDLKLMSVNVRSGSTFDFDTPKVLFQTRIDNFSAPNRYVVADNGQRFLINVPVGHEIASPITVTMNMDLEEGGNGGD